MESKYSLRFVILHHTGIPSLHFDLLFETTPDSELTGARLNTWPVTSDTQIKMSSLHRRTYLTYEGAVSGGRGSVKRICSGTCNVRFETTALTVSFPDGTELKVPIPVKE